MKEMIIGCEAEYGVYIKCPPASASGKFKPDNNREYIFNKFDEAFKKTINIVSVTSTFLKNGGRLYLDTGAHPEFATPECSNIYDVVKYIRAGHKILQAKKTAIELELRKNLRFEAEIDFCHDTKTYNVDGKPENQKNKQPYVTYGNHENYLISRPTFDLLTKNPSKLVGYLLTFLATRIIFSGSGSFFIKQIIVNKENRSEASFVLSPRAIFIKENMNGSTTSQRPMINTRDEPHADFGRYGRLHILCGDANRSDWSNWLKIGTTALMISLLDKKPDIFYGLPIISFPSEALKDISEHCDPKRKIILCFNRNDCLLSALEIQSLYWQRIAAYLAKEGRGGEEEKIAADWGETLDLLEQEDEKLERRLDWKIKQKWLKHLRKKRLEKGLDFNGWDMVQLDIKYHDINPSGVFETLEKKNEIEKIVPAEEISDAVFNPPPTRAALRSAIIKLRERAYFSAVIDWDTIKIFDKLFTLSDPFSKRNESLEKWLKARYNIIL